MNWRPSRGQALEQEWRSFGEPSEGGSSSFDVTGQNLVIDLATIDPADYPLDPAEPEDRPLATDAAVPLAERLTAAQQGAERRSDRKPEASPEETRRLAVEFRRAAVSLAVGSDDADAVVEMGRQAGTALVKLAEAGAEEVLGDVLRPDLDAGNTTWTVACYQIGDLSPSSLRDFSAPVEAVSILSDCEDPAHVASELIVTNGDGLRWTAMVRSGSSVTFQLLGGATSGSTPGDAGAALRSARNRWEDRLLSWAANPSSGLEASSAKAADPEPNMEVAAPLPVIGGYPPVTDFQVEARLVALEKHAVASSTDLLEVGGEIRGLRKACRDARKEAKRLHKRVERLEQEVSGLRQQLAAASQRASLSELGLSALTATVVSSVPSPPAPSAPVESAAVVVVPQAARMPIQTHSEAMTGAEWAVSRLRAWCDRRLARSGRPDRP